MGEIPAISCAILDWIDPDENTHLNGAENEEYQRRDPPYYAKNKPIDDLSELLLIRGITPEMYSGEYERSPVQQRLIGLAGRLKHQSTLFIWTKYGRRFPVDSVNINTASKDVLTIIFSGDDQAADA